MNPENNSATPEAAEVNPRSKHPVFCITPVSKYLALILFIVLPFLGGYIGYQFAPEKVVEEEKMVEIERNDPIETVASSIKQISWHIEAADPNITNSDDYNQYEQAISIDIIREDGSSKTHELGTAFGCSETNEHSNVSGRAEYGGLNCYFALSGTTFVAYSEDGKFMVERTDEDASGRTAGFKTTVLEL